MQLIKYLAGWLCLSTKMQQDFYNEIAERYNDYVEYLKQIGDYDLEVEAMNLEAGNRFQPK